MALGEILVSEPQALILDEPSANLDPEATDRLAQELLRLKQAGFAILVGSPSSLVKPCRR